MKMRSPLGYLLLWVAERLDRSLITVPDVDLPMPATAGSVTALSRQRRDAQQLWSVTPCSSLVRRSHGS
jgi:hypothetical protein